MLKSHFVPRFLAVALMASASVVIVPSAPAQQAVCSTTNGSPQLQLFTPTLSGLTATINGVVIVPEGSSLTGIDWSWGDGSTLTGCSYFPESHTYAKNGTYTVTVTTTGTNGFELKASETVNVSTLGEIAYNDLNTLITVYPAKVSAAENVVTTITSQLNPFGCFTAEQDLNDTLNSLGTVHSDLLGLSNVSTTTVISNLPHLLSAVTKAGGDLSQVRGDLDSCQTVLPDYVRSDVNEEIAGVEIGDDEIIGLALLAILGLAALA